MKKFLCFAFIMAFFLAVATAQAAEQTISHKTDRQTIKGSDQIFTGDVLIEQLYPENNSMRSSGGLVTFQPGARSNWHVHPVGQMLIVTEGEGRTQEWGKPVQVIKAGDVITCPAGVKHWHGAAPNSAMSHISICEAVEPGKVVEWLEKVTDDQYTGKQTQ